MNTSIVKIKGWVAGFNKVQSTKLIQKHLNCDLSEAKAYTDNILNNSPVSIEFSNESKASNFRDEILKIGARV